MSIFIDSPSLSELEARLIKRVTDTERKIKERVNKAKIEISHKEKFDEIIMNSDIKKASEDILNVVIKFLSV